MLYGGTNKHDFAYSVALVRTLETMLLNENEVERMMLAKSADDSFKIFNEFDYSDNTAGIEDPAEFQKVIAEGILEIKETLEKITPDKKLLLMLWLEYDFHNIKTMLKAKLSEQSFTDIEHLMNKMGAINIDKLREFIFEENMVGFGLSEEIESYIKAKIRKAEKLFQSSNKNPQVIDLYLDQKLISSIRRIAEASYNKFLINYVKHLIDLNNIRLFFRMKTQNKEQDLFELALFWHGHIPAGKFKDAYKGSISDSVESMKASPYSSIVIEGLKHYQSEKTFIFLEKEIENYLTNYIKQAKLIAFGPEPLIAYFLAKRNNALVIRMILVNKLNKVDPQEIKDRLRNLYA